MVCLPWWVRSGQKESNDIKRGGRSLSSGRSSKNCCFFVLAQGLGQVKTDSWMPLRSINVKLSRNLAICFQHLTIRVNPNGIFNLHSIFMKKRREVVMMMIVATIAILWKGSTCIIGHVCKHNFESNKFVILIVFLFILTFILLFPRMQSSNRYFV